MIKPSIFIVGAGGHGKVVYDAIISQNYYEVAGFVDDNIEVGTEITAGTRIICSQKRVLDLKAKVEYFIVAIGNNLVRKTVYEQLLPYFTPATVIHKSSAIGSGVTIAKGTVVLAQAVINSMSQVGENTIINTGVIVDHECIIGNHVYLKLGTIVTNSCVVDDLVTTNLKDLITPSIV